MSTRHQGFDTGQESQTPEGLRFSFISPRIQTSTVGGRSLTFIDGGDTHATNLLALLHAFPVGVHMFDPQIRAFDGWRGIVPALPGFDESDVVDPASADAYARHLLVWLDGLGVTRAVFGGVSLGGYLSLALPQLAPDRVAGLILADTRCVADTDEARARRRRLLETLRQSGPPGYDLGSWISASETKLPS